MNETNILGPHRGTVCLTCLTIVKTGFGGVDQHRDHLRGVSVFFGADSGILGGSHLRYVSLLRYEII